MCIRDSETPYTGPPASKTAYPLPVAVDTSRKCPVAPGSSRHPGSNTAGGPTAPPSRATATAAYILPSPVCDVAYRRRADGERAHPGIIFAASKQIARTAASWTLRFLSPNNVVVGGGVADLSGGGGGELCASSRPTVVSRPFLRGPGGMWYRWTVRGARNDTLWKKPVSSGVNAPTAYGLCRVGTGSPGTDIE